MTGDIQKSPMNQVGIVEAMVAEETEKSFGVYVSGGLLSSILVSSPSLVIPIPPVYPYPHNPDVWASVLAPDCALT